MRSSNRSNVTFLATKKRKTKDPSLPFELGPLDKIDPSKITKNSLALLLDKQKEKIGKIVIEVLENGAIFVNGKPLGKN